MRANFPASLAAVLVHEGGYVNDPRDPGGATNRGVTQAVYDDWRRSKGLDPRSVKSLEQPEVEAIYRKLYWDAVRGDELPSGVDYCLFDFAVNSGAPRASRYLQRVLSATEDGNIGPVTLALANSGVMPAKEIIEHVCTDRLNFLKQLNTFDRFGKGWTARVEDVCAKAKAMAS